MNSNSKGKRGERAWRDELKAAGYSARRGQQFAGNPESADVVCSALEPLRFEVKNCERGSVYAFMAQAVRDAGATKIPVLAMKRNAEAFLIVLRAVDFFRLLHACDLSALSASERKAVA